MPGAFLYLTVCSVRNGVRLRVRRLRQPRYLLLTVAAVLYFGLMLSSRPAAGVVVISPPWQARAPFIAPGVAALLLASAWVWPGAALHFTQADIQFLFPAPVSRRRLIAYKLWRLLVLSLSTTLLFGLFVAPPRVVPAVMLMARTFVIMAILGFYQAGASLSRGRAKDARRLQGLNRVAAVAAAVVLTPAIAWVLARVALAPPGELPYVLPLAFLTLVVSAAWVLGTDAAFEEAAVDGADRLQRIRAGAAAPARSRTNRSSPFRLAPGGPVESAILWKNWMLIGRPSRALTIASLFLLAMLAGLLFAVSTLFESDRAAVFSVIASGVIVLMGPLMLRIDMRQDLAHLSVIKTWPVRGSAVIRGEVLAPFIALALAAAIPIVLACALDTRVVFEPAAAVTARIAFASAGVLVASAVILAQLVIQNGLAVTFPGWVRITPPTGGGAGIENMMQMMVTMYGGFLLLALAAVVPGVSAIVIGWLTGAGAWTFPVLPSAAFTLLVVAECLAATELLGRVLDRADLQDVAVSEG